MIYVNQKSVKLSSLFIYLLIFFPSVFALVTRCDVDLLLDSRRPRQLERSFCEIRRRLECTYSAAERRTHSRTQSVLRQNICLVYMVSHLSFRL